MALGRVPEIGIRYVVDVADKGTRQLLADDRKVRREVSQTARVMRQATQSMESGQNAAARATGRHAAAEDRLGRESSSTGRILDRQDRSLAGVARGHQRAAVTAERHDRSLRGLNVGSRLGAGGFALFGRGAGLAAGFVGAAGLGGAVRFMAQEVGEAQQVTAQTNAALTSTGKIANVSARGVSNLASALARKTGIDDELIQSGSNVILTFTRIRNEVGQGNRIFDRANKAALDLSVRFGKDLNSSAVMVGKALNDPVRGLTSLSRAGVQFTEQQKEQITALVESGRTLEAQRLVLAELETQVGGSAKAYGTTLPGALGRARVAAGDLAEEYGNRLAPSVDRAVTAGIKFVRQMESGKGKGGEFRKTLDELFKGFVQIARPVATAVRGVAEFAGKHPILLKLAGGVLAVGVAVRALRFAGAITGVDHLIGGLGRLARTQAGQRATAAIRGPFTRLWSRLSGPISNVVSNLVSNMRVGGRRAGAAAGTQIAARTSTVAAADFATAAAPGGKLGKGFLTAGKVLGKAFGLAAGVAAVTWFASWLEEHINFEQILKDKIPGGGTAGKILDFDIGDLFNRRGGRVTGTGPSQRFNTGGMVPIAVSPGELLAFPGGGVATVPGSRTAADNVLAAVPSRTMVFTDSGQDMLAAGATYGQALASQLPHFQGGGVAEFNKRYPRHGLGDAEGKFQMSERQVRGVAENAGFNPGRALQMAQIARGESTYYPGIVSSDGGWGLWQHTPRTWGSLGLSWLSSLGGLGAMLNPVKNAKMAKKLYDDSGFGPWYGTRFLDRNLDPKGIESVLKGRLGRSKKGRSKLSYSGRLPSKASAFAGGFQAGLEGTRLWDTDILRSILSATSTRVARQPKARGSGGTKAAGVGGSKAYPFARAAQLIGTPYAGTHNLGNWQSDNAIDLGIPMGTATRAVIPGKIGRISGGWGGGSSRFDGFQVYLAGQGDQWWYTHLQRAGVRSGQSVKAGQRIGVSGAANGVPHLHLARQPPADPRDVLKWPRARRGGIVGGLVQRFQSGGTPAPFTRVTEDDPRWNLKSSLDKLSKAVERLAGRRSDGGSVSPRRDLGGRINQITDLPATDNEGFKRILKEWTKRITTLDETSKLFVRDQIEQLEGTLKEVRGRIRQIRRGGVTRREQPQLRRLRDTAGDIVDQTRELQSSLKTEYGWNQLQRFEGRLGRNISRLQRGREDRGQRVQIRRLQAMQRVIQAELGRRLGALVGRIDKQIEGLTTDETRFSQSQRIRGVDETSAQGLGERRDFLQAEVNKANQLKTKLQTALKRAVKRGDKTAVEEIQGRLATLEDTIAETFTQLVEAQNAEPQGSLTDPNIDMRQALAALTPDTADDKAAAQERVTHAENVLQFVQAAGAGPEVITEAATNLKSAMDALAEDADAAGSALQEDIRALTEELKRSSDIAETVTAIGLRTAQRALADVLSGQIQSQLSQRARSAGDGMIGATY